MPEWPEVTITTRSLQELCSGKKLVRVKVEHGLKYNVAPFAPIAQALPLVIERVTRKGKNIIFELEGEQRILSHMMLTGSWSTTKNEHTCVTLVLEDETRLYYRDTRRFGRL